MNSNSEPVNPIMISRAAIRSCECSSGVTNSHDLMIYGLDSHLGGCLLRLTGSPHCPADTRQELFRAEWFGDVIIRTQFQEQNFVLNLGIGAQDNYGHRGCDDLEFTA